MYSSGTTIVSPGFMFFSRHPVSVLKKTTIDCIQSFLTLFITNPLNTMYYTLILLCETFLSTTRGNSNLYCRSRVLLIWLCHCLINIRINTKYILTNRVSLKWCKLTLERLTWGQCSHLLFFYQLYPWRIPRCRNGKNCFLLHSCKQEWGVLVN